MIRKKCIRYPSFSHLCLAPKLVYCKHYHPSSLKPLILIHRNRTPQSLRNMSMIQKP